MAITRDPHIRVSPLLLPVFVIIANTPRGHKLLLSFLGSRLLALGSVFG